MRTSILLLAMLGVLLWSCGDGSSSANTDAQRQTEESQPELPPRPPRDQVIEVDDLASPESVIGDGNFYYVSNVGTKLEPSAKDGDGFIAKLDTAGEVVEAKFITGLDAPKGSAIIDGTFYVADIDQVRAYDLASGEAQEAIDFSETETEFLNDLVAGPEGTLFVSATDINKIFQINLADGSYSELKTDGLIPGPNGLWYDEAEDDLYVVSFVEGNQGKPGVLDLSKSPATYQTVAEHRGSLDGVAKIDNYLLVSDWKTQSIVIVDLDEGRVVTEHPMSARIQGPADFYYDPMTGELWVPGMQMNKLFVKTSAIK